MLWRAGMLAVVWAALLGVVALLRPLAPGGSSPWLRLSVTLAIGLGVAGSAVLASLKTRGQAAVLAFYAFLVLALDALGQVVGPHGWPIWPLMALLVAAVAVADGQLHAFGVAALATLLAAADAAATSFTTWKTVLAGGFGYLVARVRDPPCAALREAAPRFPAGGAGAADVGHRPARRRLRCLAAHPRAGRPAAGVGGRTPRAAARSRRGAGRGAHAPGQGGALRHRCALGPVLRPRPRPRTPRSCAPPTARRSCASRRWCRSRRTRSRSCSTASSRSTRPTSSASSGRCRTSATRSASARCWRCRC